MVSRHLRKTGGGATTSHLASPTPAFARTRAQAHTPSLGSHCPSCSSFAFGPEAGDGWDGHGITEFTCISTTAALPSSCVYYFLCQDGWTRCTIKSIYIYISSSVFFLLIVLRVVCKGVGVSLVHEQAPAKGFGCLGPAGYPICERRPPRVVAAFSLLT